ncbi:TPA: tail fiber assembly protein [Serratia marcescens]|nr:tail fiber assembly protein [Serratia liquefaciens]HEN7341783.1 tail fiber assembly protein [Serratia marcescens]HEN7410508.1 tail fiber assembly protein [Serratia marcescens]
MSNFSFSDSDQALWLYHFDSTGVYIGSGLAMIPAGTGLPAKTTITPCNSPEGKTGVWDGESWEYVQDNRGVRYWNKYGSGSVVVAIDEVIPVDAILIEPPKKQAGFVLLFESGEWQQIEDKAGKKYYDNLGGIHIVPEPYFILPEGNTFVEPPEPKLGFATQWAGLDWIYVEDHRGKTAYHIEDGSPVVISDVGALPDTLTFIMPATPFDEWNGTGWVTNQDAVVKNQVEQARQKKNALRNEADEEIAVLSDAVKYGIATEDEIAKLEAWSRYRVLLMRVEPELAPNIEWPAKP